MPRMRRFRLLRDFGATKVRSRTTPSIGEIRTLFPLNRASNCFQATTPLQETRTVTASNPAMNRALCLGTMNAVSQKWLRAPLPADL